MLTHLWCGAISHMLWTLRAMSSMCSHVVKPVESLIVIVGIYFFLGEWVNRCEKLGFAGICLNSQCKGKDTLHLVKPHWKEVCLLDSLYVQEWMVSWQGCVQCRHSAGLFCAQGCEFFMFVAIMWWEGNSATSSATFSDGSSQGEETEVASLPGLTDLLLLVNCCRRVKANDEKKRQAKKEGKRVTLKRMVSHSWKYVMYNAFTHDWWHSQWACDIKIVWDGNFSIWLDLRYLWQMHCCAIVGVTYLFVFHSTILKRLWIWMASLLFRNVDFAVCVSLCCSLFSPVFLTLCEQWRMSQKMLNPSHTSLLHSGLIKKSTSIDFLLCVWDLVNVRGFFCCWGDWNIRTLPE